MKPFRPPSTPLPAALALLGVLAGAPALGAQLPAPPVSSPAPLRLGGYGAFTLRADASRAADSAGVEVNEAAAALLVSGTLVPRLGYFAEVEAASVSRENWTGREDARWVEVERLYAELTVADALRLRAGRFLTPVGQWNEIHAAPLTLTAARPLTSYRAFAKSTTGVMVAGQLALAGRDAGYALYVAPFGIAEGEESEFLRALGGRVAVELLPDLFVGGSAARFHGSRRIRFPEEEPEDDDRLAPASTRSPRADHEPGHDEEDDEDDGDDDEEPGEDDRELDDEGRTLLGADLSWRWRGLQLLAEATYVSPSEEQPRERGAFVQAAVALPLRLHLVGRTEHYDPVVTGPLRVHTLGAAWRPDPRFTVKLERQLTDRPSTRVADGWLVSLSALF